MGTCCPTRSSAGAVRWMRSTTMRPQAEEARIVKRKPTYVMQIDAPIKFRLEELRAMKSRGGGDAR
jgi:hypothetical protein